MKWESIPRAFDAIHDQADRIGFCSMTVSLTQGAALTSIIDGEGGEAKFGGGGARVLVALLRRRGDGGT